MKLWMCCSATRKFLVVLVLLVIAGVSGWYLYRSWRAEDQSIRSEATDSELGKSDVSLWKSDFYLEDPAFGAVDAPVEISYFFSLTCPACKRFHQQVLPAIKAGLIETGLVRMTWVGFPTDSTSMTLEVVARYQASYDRYLEAIKFVYSEEADTRSGKLLIASLRNHRETSGDFATARFTDLQQVGRQARDFIAAKRTEIIRKLGVQSVPTLIINGEIYRGEINYAAIAAYVKKLAQEQ